MSILYSKCMIDPDDCIVCGICEKECPQGAIVPHINPNTGDETYIILQNICNCCNGESSKRCIDICPIDCIKCDKCN